ncbi:MAG: phage head-tail connector protein [Alphaproteobacteria bacterium]
MFPCLDQTDALKLITPPASEPLSLTEAKSFLRVEDTSQDDVITRAITAARQAAEQYLRCALLPQTWEYAIANPLRTEIRLPFGPAQSITGVATTDESGATATLAGSAYRLSVDGGLVIFLQRLRCVSVAITYSASIAADADAVPALIKQGMLHHVAAIFEQRDGNAGLPMQSIACYMPYRRISL